MKYRTAAASLIALGCLQMAGDLVGSRELRAMGLASHASPAPKVFTSQDGFEPFSSRFFIDWIDIEPRDAGSKASRWQTIFEVTCQEVQP